MSPEFVSRPTTKISQMKPGTRAAALRATADNGLAIRLPYSKTIGSGYTMGLKHQGYRVHRHRDPDDPNFVFIWCTRITPNGAGEDPQI